MTNYPKVKCAEDGTILNHEEVDAWIKAQGFPVCDANFDCILDDRPGDLMDEAELSDMEHEARLDWQDYMEQVA